LAGGSARAADVEYRDFNISVDGKPAGEYKMTIHTQDQGRVVMTGEANVRVKYLVYTYTYFFRGTETWQGNRLVRLDSTANENGKRLAVAAVAEGQGLRVKANGQERVTQPDVWPTTYWRLPDARFRNGSVELLDADTGRPIRARMQLIGTEQIAVAGQMQNCTHYRLSNGVQVDAWFDAQERLIRQDSIEDGHRTILELARIRR
jgi:hypothetical protein